MSIYENVKKACEENGTSVTNLEEKLGFSRSSIFKWNKNRPSVDKVKAVADEPHKSIEYFLEE